MNNNTEIDIEIQLSAISVWADRALFYLAKMFTDQINSGEDSRHFLYTDKMEFHVLELPKLPKELREDSSDIELWGKFINAERKEDFDMLAEKNVYWKCI